MDNIIPHDFMGDRRECIAIVSHVHPSISKGGAEISAYSVYQGLLALGYDAIFIAAVPEDARARLSLASSREFAVYCDPTSYDYFYHIAASAPRDQLLEILARNGVTTVNFHHFMNFGTNALRAVAELPGVRTVLTIHEFIAICHHHGQMITRPAQILCEKSSTTACGTCFPENSGQQFALRRRHFLDAFSALDGMISPSQFLAERYIQWGAPAERMHVIENGLMHVPPTAPPRRKRPGDNSWVFGYFGQINPFKGVSTLLDAADLIAEYEDLPDTLKIRVHGNLVGQTPEFIARFEESIAKHSFLTYAGAYDNSAVARLMSECDYVIIPSGWWENSPVVIQEAYAVGRPVICTGIGGMAEKIIDQVTGLHFNLRDHVDLVRVIEIAATPQMYAKLRSGLPAVPGSVKMATEYLAAFEQFPAAIKPVPMEDLPDPDPETAAGISNDGIDETNYDVSVTDDIVQSSEIGQTAIDVDHQPE
ncbi:MAG: hypothetical protein JWR77_392, partial [Rhizorhabdus sp.]|nr:hypothetical protein [Rhizorhabdus sp.]